MVGSEVIALLEAGKQALFAGNAATAVELMSQVAAMAPGTAEADCWLSVALARLGRLREAVEPYLRAEEHFPELTDGLPALAETLEHLRCFLEAGLVRKRLTFRRPDDYEAWLMLEHWYWLEDFQEEALDAAAHAQRLRPFALAPRLARCMAQLRKVYDSSEQIAAARSAYRNELHGLAAWVDRELERIEDPWSVGRYMPFFLPYQGGNDRTLQSLLGGIVTRVMHSAYPQWARRPPMPAATRGGPLRIGVVSGFFREHAVWKMHLRYWMEGFDRRRFRLYGYHTGMQQDDITTLARAGFDKFVDCLPVARMAEQIRADNLHVLIHSEVGMNPTAMCLAALRLAPLQFLSSNQPETSGLPTIDTFVSSDAMEPENAAAHYTERLVRLPGLGTVYRAWTPSPIDADWKALGLRDDARIYLCAQNPSKILPVHDALFASIAAGVSNSQFVFLDAHPYHHPTRHMMARIAAGFRARGIDPERHLLLLPKLSSPNYAALNRRCHVFLDTIGWNGCNTTFEALAAGLPVVTMPGAMMRGRHASAILTCAGLRQLIAADPDEYVKKAVRLATDEDERLEAAQACRAGMELIHADTSPVEAFQDFLEEEVYGAMPSGKHAG